MNKGEHILRHVVVRGRVQGVGFRAFVEQQALRHGIEGWVRNRRDGSVEALFVGVHAAVEAIVATCESGPLGSRVDALDQREGNGDEFSIRRSGERFSCLPTV